MDGIQDFVLRGGQRVTAGALAGFRQKLPLVLAKAGALDGLDGFPSLGRQAQFLARFVEDVLDGTHAAGDLLAVPEAAFALGYLMKDVDIIPDELPGRGYADDSAVVRAVLAAHPQEFHAYAQAAGIDLPPSAP